MKTLMYFFVLFFFTVLNLILLHSGCGLWLCFVVGGRHHSSHGLIVLMGLIEVVGLNYTKKSSIVK